MVSLLAAAGPTVTLLEVVPVKLPLLKAIVMVSALVYERFANVTKPLIAVTLVVPCKAAVPALRVAVTTVLLSVVTRFPNASSSRTTGAGENAAPAVAVVGGWVAITSLAAAAAFTVNELLIPSLRPLALAVNCLLLPAESISRLLKAAVPLPAPVPMS